MKKFSFLCALLLAAFWSNAQNNPINFETGGFGANWTWTVFENDTNPPVEIVANPSPTGINPSATVAKITAMQTGNPWAGCESLRGATNLGHFVLGPSNSVIKVMVWKSVISDVGIKLVSDSGWAQPEIKVSNTLINQWEELTFNFASYVNPPASQGQLSQIVFFPDFNMSGRTQSNTVYFDNITFSAGSVAPSPLVPAPTPSYLAANVISIYSDAYTNVAGTNFNPNWGQATVVSPVSIQGNNTLKYSNLNYQGIELGSSVNVSQMDFLHLDYWSTSSTSLEIFLISPGPVETPVALTVPTNGWASIDIPLSSFSPVNLSNVFQFKFVGNGEFFMDNLLFRKFSIGLNPIAKTNDIKVYPNPVNVGQMLQLDGEIDNIHLYNLQGQLVLNSQATQINTQNLAPGMYVLHITAKNGERISQKLVLN